ncbi:MAG TPA: glutamate racemase [Acidisarcina sp.]|nr:glutamate racemase [Acidisarcina sp.]
MTEPSSPAISPTTLGPSTLDRNGPDRGASHSGPRIGVFDSGFGGLTVLKTLLPSIPGAQYIYLGDTARLPYGSKSQATIARYAVSSARFLLDQGAEFLVIACNTASALALEDIRAAVPVPVLGVIEPGVSQAKKTSRSGDILVIGTDATVQSHAYRTASRNLGLNALEKACPLLVPLVEEGWVGHPVTAEVVRIYLSELAAEASAAGLSPDTLVLGCTHYPLLRPVIEKTVPWNVVDAAEMTALETRRQLAAVGAVPDASAGPATSRFFATDSVAKFRRLGAAFLGQPMGEVELVDLGG